MKKKDRLTTKIKAILTEFLTSLVDTEQNILLLF